MEFDAVVLAGGRASRLGGADKASLEVDGAPLLEWALSAVANARKVAVVGDRVPTSRKVSWVREIPRYAGPVAATYAGRAMLGPSTGLAVVLAVDMPHVTAATVQRLVDGADGHDGAVLTDHGRRHLAFAVRMGALDRVRPVPTTGAAMRDLWASLDLEDVPAAGDEAQDIDRWTDLDRPDPEGLNVWRG